MAVLRQLVAVSALMLLAVSTVSAGFQREKPNLWAAMETPGPKPEAEMQWAPLPPTITERPHARDLLEKRDANTCGYTSGLKNEMFKCNYTGAECFVETKVSAVGCCATTNCNIYTACLPFLSSDQMSTLDMDRTRYCSNSASPFCAPLMYTDPIFKGYTIPNCEASPTTIFVSYSVSPSDSSTSSKSTLELTTEPGSTSTSERETESSDPTQAPTAGGPAGGSNNNQNPPAESSSSTPIGPIVGGVVGGVAVLALIALGIFLLMRKKKKADTPSPPAQPPVAPYTQPPAGYPPQMAPSDMSSPGAASAAGTYYDPRYSMVKPPMSTVTDPNQPPMSPPFNVSPSQSPPPMYPQQNMQQQHYMGPPPPHMATNNITPPPHHGHMGPTPPPMQQQQPYGYQGGGQTHAAELPTQRGDGQVYEAP